MADKPRLGEMLRMLGTGTARKSGEAVVKNRKKKKSKLDEITSGIKQGRRSK